MELRRARGALRRRPHRPEPPGPGHRGGRGHAGRTPRAGAIHWSAYQEHGAGYYVVVRADDGRDYVFMHLQEGSVAVQRGQPVAAGRRLGAVGATGDADGPHLHFEIWPDGWWASDASRPIDPLPDLQAWAAG